MTVVFGGFDLHLLAWADAHGRAQTRIERARISASAQRTLPDFHRDDIAVVRSGSWRFLRRDEVGDEQPDALGRRLYLLAFEGLFPYIKVGMIKVRSSAALHTRSAVTSTPPKSSSTSFSMPGPRSPAPRIRWPSMGRIASTNG
ncbi:hypothetical protein ACFU6O_00600 [Streptomyces albidoflavus]